MRCKSGDLAIVIRAPAGIKYQIGLLVECVSLVTNHQGLPCWVLKHPIKDHAGTCIAIADKDLMPIRDPGPDAVDETLRERPAPKQATPEQAADRAWRELEKLK